MDMKTVRLLYPDYVSGGSDTYYFGANLLRYILPQNEKQPSKLTMDKLSEVMRIITDNADVVGFTIAEYLPFDERRLHKMLSGIPIFTE